MFERLKQFFGLAATPTPEEKPLPVMPRNMLAKYPEGLKIRVCEESWLTDVGKLVVKDGVLDNDLAQIVGDIVDKGTTPTKDEVEVLRQQLENRRAQQCVTCGHAPN